MKGIRTVGRVGLACALVAASASGAAAQDERFADRTAEVGISHEFLSGFDRIGSSVHLYDWAQSGLALGDLDGDGDLDIVALGGVLPNRVLRNDGGTFTDVTDLAGINAGEFDRMPALGDYDKDGDLDLFVGAVDRGAGVRAGRSRLYRNDGGFVFEEVTTVAGTVGAGHSIHAKWVDVNLDGWLDLYVSEFHGTRNRHYRNNGDGTFTEMASEIGADAAGSTHVSGVLDSDFNGYYDLFVGNDWVATSGAGLPGNAGDYELHCRTDFTFEDVTAGSGNDIERAIMGLAYGDVDYDGRMDMYKSDGGENYLMVNRGWPGSGQPWVEMQVELGVPGDLVPDPANPGEMGPAVSWGAVFLDADHDRWIDLFVANGFVSGNGPIFNPHPRNQQNIFYKGLGPSAGNVFVDETEQSGLIGAYDDRGVAAGDMDGDGDLDLFVAETAGPLRYYENNIEQLGDRGWLLVRPTCQTSAPGCQGVRVSRDDANGDIHLRVLGTDAPTASQHDEQTAHFGLGPEQTTNLSVHFPSGITLEYADVAANTVVEPVEPELVRLSPRAVERRGLFGTSTFTVTVFAHDAAGNPLDGGADVSIDVPGALEWSFVRHVEGNRFEQDFLVPREIGLYRTEVRIDDFDLHVEPTLLVYGGPALSGSKFWVSPEAVRAGSEDRFTVTVVPGDRNGFRVEGGLDISAEVDGRGPVVGPTELDDGRYVMEFVAPASPGLYDVDVTYNGRVVGGGGQLQIEVGGEAAEATSRFYTELGTIVNSLEPGQLKLLVSPRDGAGLRVGPGADVRLEVIPDAGTEPLLVRDDLYGPQADGEFPFVLEKQTPPEIVASGVIDVFVDGTRIGDLSYDF